MPSTHLQAAQDASERRAHRRIASSELPEAALFRIPNRPAVSLVDLSPGGALIELPFQLRPESRITVELYTADEQLTVPFQLLRCYVAGLDGGVRYHAAGAFPQALRLSGPFGADELIPATSSRLIATLEGFLRMSRAADPSPRGARFNELLAWAVAGLRQGESPNLISTKVKARVAQLFPSLAIRPASSSVIQDASRSAQFFGLDFKSNRLLTASDRRFLRASAQLITLIDRNAESQSSPFILRTAGEWQALQKQTVQRFTL